MRKIRLLYSIILLTARRGNRKLIVNCTKKDLIYLSLLKSINILEYSKLPISKSKYAIVISYCNGRPVLNDIVSINLNQEGSIGLSNWNKESNSKRALYIAYTANGAKIVDSSSTGLKPTRLLFRVEFN